MKFSYKIQEASIETLPLIKVFLDHNFIYSGYIQGNINSYGLKNNFYSLYTCFNKNNNLVFVGAKYFNSIQCLYIEDDNKFISLFCKFLKINKIIRVSGNFALMKSIYECTDAFSISVGKILLLDEKKFFTPFFDYNFKNAKTKNDFFKIATLLCTDSSFGKNYNPELLSFQLFERFQRGNGRTLYCENKNNVISSVSTYAETDKLAVISGVITDDNYKGNGIATYLLGILKNQLISEKKKILIYYFDDSLETFYKRLGFSQECICAKLEIK